MGRNTFITLGKIKSKNDSMKDILSSLDYIASLNLNMLIIGERGTGKDTFVGMFHELCPKSDVSMNIIRCSSVMYKDIVLSESAMNYVDGVHLLGSVMQRALKREIEAKPDALVVASADSCIIAMRDNGFFSSDLYNYLACIRIGVPRLLQRKEDIPCMVRDALRISNIKYNKRVKIDGCAMKPLLHYNYTENITELYSIIDRAVLSCTSELIKVNSILSILDMDSLSLVSMMSGSDLSYRESVSRFQRELISNAVNDTSSADEAALLLDVKKSFLIRKCKEFNISLAGGRSAAGE